MDNTSIKKNIRSIRKARKYTQEEMADKMGMSLTAYRDLEKGETSIVNTNLRKVARLLDTTTEELVLGYRPIQMDGPGLEDIKEEYTGRISALEKRIADLERLVRTLEETVAAKNEIITMLKNSLDGDK
ncbi:MAG: helix-turn-helix transcriptional regulator [Bacteroidales bacterium]|nr:helix-turn-helix transcriptional regulator [Bacteroidales bacterium]MBQ9723120.1 helix-turn-helix transcriptional regulator [Bacteroidales bacterium]